MQGTFGKEEAGHENTLDGKSDHSPDQIQCTEHGKRSNHRDRMATSTGFPSLMNAQVID